MTDRFRIYIKARITLRQMWRRVMSSRAGTAVRESIEDFRCCIDEYGFRYGVRMWMFPPMSAEKFCEIMIDYELRHYPGVTFRYLMSLPKQDRAPSSYEWKNVFGSGSDPVKVNKVRKEMLDFVKGNVMKMNTYYRDGIRTEYQDDWYRRYRFKSKREFDQFKRKFFRLYPKTKPYKINKDEISRSFSMFDLQYGLMRDYDEGYDL